MSSPVGRLSYHQDLFANRQEIITLVRSSVERLRQGSPPDRRVVRCYGVAGSGKSWLLRHLQQIIQDESSKTAGPQILALRLCLVEDPAHLANDPVWTYPLSLPVDAQIIVPLLRWLIERVIEARGATPAWTDATDDQQRLSERLGNEITTTGRPLVLLVDGLDEHPKEVIKVVEEYCLLPLLQRRDVLLILAVRLPPSLVYPWSRELVFHSQDYVLTPFSSSDVQDQLAKAKAANVQPLPTIGPAQADEIILKGGGYPQSNLALASAFDPSIGGWPNPAQTFRSEADRLLTSVKAHLRPAFEALCVLRQFDEYGMADWLQAYGLPASSSITPTDLTRTRLAQWDSRVNAYVMDEALRRLLENALYFENRDRWRALHQAARLFYQEWVADYPRTADRWRAEAEFHEMCLKVDQPLPH